MGAMCHLCGQEAEGGCGRPKCPHKKEYDGDPWKEEKLNTIPVTETKKVTSKVSPKATAWGNFENFGNKIDAGENPPEEEKPPFPWKKN